MTIVIGLLAFFLLLDLAALKGWAPSTRDGRDWQGRPDFVAARHGQAPPRVVSSDPSESRSDAACDPHARTA